MSDDQNHPNNHNHHHHQDGEPRPVNRITEPMQRLVEARLSEPVGQIFEQWSRIKDPTKPPFTVNDIAQVYLMAVILTEGPKSPAPQTPEQRRRTIVRFWEFAARRHREIGSETAPLVVYEMSGGDVLDLSTPLPEILTKELVDNQDVQAYVRLLHSMALDLEAGGGVN